MYKFIKRSFDIFAIGIVILILPPLLIPVMIWLKCTGGHDIFLGDMSIVGPRLLVDKTFNPYPPDVKARICSVRPGLTGIGSESVFAKGFAEHRDEMHVRIGRKGLMP